jgi:hypothetical protein
MRTVNADDQQSSRKESPTTITKEQKPTCSQRIPNGRLWPLSSDGVVASDCRRWNLHSDNASHDRCCEPSSGEKAKMKAMKDQGERTGARYPAVYTTKEVK